MKNSDTAMPISVVHVVDDQPAMLRMVAELIESISAKAVTYSSAKDFLASYRPRERECLVSDMRMPGMSGMEFFRVVREHGHTLPVIFITGYAEVGTAVDAMKQGAFDYIEKPFNHQAFLEKVQNALVQSEAIYKKGMQRRTAEARISLLTPTELKILRLVAKGKSSKEAGEALGISARTVDNHRGRIMEKLHVDSTVEMALMFTDLQGDTH